VTATTSTPHRDLLELVTVAEFLIRNGQHGAAVVATERLSEALLTYYQGLPGSAASPQATGLRRDTLRLWAEVRLCSNRLRIGPVRRVPALRRQVEALLMSETLAAAPTRPATA
jgi:hypothetical protein